MNPRTTIRGWLCATALLSVSQSASAYEFDTKHNTVTLSSLADFDRCQQETGGADGCLDGLDRFVKAHPGEAFAAGKLVRLNFNHWVALPFFEKAVAKPKPEQCADADLALAVVSGLALPPADQNAARALKIADGKCSEALRPKLQAGLKGAGAYYVANTCPALKAKGIEAAECAPVVAAKPVAPAPPSTLKLASLDPRSLALDASSAMSFRGQEREQVLLLNAKSKQGDVVLVKLKGLRGPWNNQVLLTLEKPQSRGKDYVANVDGKDWIILSLRDGSYELYPKGYPDAVHIYREQLADEGKPMASSDVLKEFAPKAEAKK
ncbi:MAG: hypothetical protein JWN04_372 [Myxococcaceae bacterium]|nr:hypothetical protein [Myxococcaceae bacterium]